MKKYLLLSISLCLLSATTLAQTYMSGEVDTDIVLNSASSMSGEIDIALPFDPLEVEDPSGELPPYTLNSASYVETGPAAIIMFLSALILGTALYAYRSQSQKD